jgi:predicted AlkP superfamily pyrophosphatase or phosphodiesterase
MHPTAVINVVGLTGALLGDDTPHLNALLRQGSCAPVRSVLPAVTCTAQATYLTGTMPNQHGIVGNGWYFRDLAQVLFWRQANRLVSGEKVWETARRRDPSCTCAKMFWWYNMYSSADWSATPRPMYPADGRKIPDHYAEPPDLHDELDARLGPFPLFKFWGPAADIASSEWIARATMHVRATRKPTLTLCYLPHLDYNLQRLGPDLSHPRLIRDLEEIDALAGELIEQAEQDGTRIVVVSEYGITPVQGAIHINRVLREAGLIRVRVEMGRELLDAGASRAFALADHQVAHVYVQHGQAVPEVKALLEGVAGIERVLDAEGKRSFGLDHPRSGELVAIAAQDRWFSYYYWLDDARAPDFARTVDIHRKPGYDPVELFVDPAIRVPPAAIGWRLLKRKLGARTLLDVISLKDTQLVKGSHGRITDDPDHGPLVISSAPDLLPDGPLPATDFKRFVLAHVFDRA